MKLKIKLHIPTYFIKDYYIKIRLNRLANHNFLLKRISTKMAVINNCRPIIEQMKITRGSNSLTVTIINVHKSHLILT